MWWAPAVKWPSCGMLCASKWQTCTHACMHAHTCMHVHACRQMNRQIKLHKHHTCSLGQNLHWSSSLTGGFKVTHVWLSGIRSHSSEFQHRMHQSHSNLKCFEHWHQPLMSLAWHSFVWCCVALVDWLCGLCHLVWLPLMSCHHACTCLPKLRLWWHQFSNTALSCPLHLHC